MAEFTKEQLIEEVNYNLEHCFCSDKTKRLMEIALAALTETQLPQPAVLSVPDEIPWICPYISRHLLSLNPLLACCRRYSRGER